MLLSPRREGCRPTLLTYLFPMHPAGTPGTSDDGGIITRQVCAGRTTGRPLRAAVLKLFRMGSCGRDLLFCCVYPSSQRKTNPEREGPVFRRGEPAVWSAGERRPDPR